MMNPKTKQPALSPFLLSKPASEHPFYLGKGTENATQLSRCDSIEQNGRMDTIADPPILSSSAKTGTALKNRPTIGLEQQQTAAECESTTPHWLSNRQVRAESRFSVFLRYSSFLSRLMG